jgi:tRNA (guanine37-N1)-methyltransferase
MRIDIITVQPQLLESPFNHSIIKRARDKKLAEIYLHNLRDYTTNKYKTVDDYAYGGGAGMVLMVEPISKCIEKLQEERKYDEVIYMTPDGNRLEQKTSNRLSNLKNIIILCGHYKGVDQRVRDKYISLEVSIGDYVLTGGELPAAILCDSIIRLIPGVLSDETSALSDSFQDNLLAPPVYTRPKKFKGMEVPNILLSGDEKAIDEWRHEQALKRTRERRKDLLNEED